MQACEMPLFQWAVYVLRDQSGSSMRGNTAKDKSLGETKAGTAQEDLIAGIELNITVAVLFSQTENTTEDLQHIAPAAAQWVVEVEVLWTLAKSQMQGDSLSQVIPSNPQVNPPTSQRLCVWLRRQVYIFWLWDNSQLIWLGRI